MSSQISKLKIIKDMIMDLENINMFIYYPSIFQIIDLISDLIKSIKLIITDYYLLNILEFEKIKEHILNNLILLKTKTIFIDPNNTQISNINNIIYLTGSVYYPTYLIHPNHKVKFYHKQNSIGVKNNFYDYFDELDILEELDELNEPDEPDEPDGPDKLDKLDKLDKTKTKSNNKTNKKDEEIEFNELQRKNIKNPIVSELMVVKNEIDKINTNKKQYNIVSKKIKINWKKSYIII